MLVAMIVVTETASVLSVIEVKTPPVLITSQGPVVSRELLVKMTSSALYIIIVQEEVTQLPGVSTLHQARAGTGLVALKISIKTQT